MSPWCEKSSDPSCEELAGWRIETETGIYLSCDEHLSWLLNWEGENRVYALSGDSP